MLFRSKKDIIFFPHAKIFHSKVQRNQMRYDALLIDSVHFKKKIYVQILSAILKELDPVFESRGCVADARNRISKSN